MQIINIETLKYRWKNLLKLFQVEAISGQIVFNELVAAYSNANHFYHTLKHLQQVLGTIEELQKLTVETIDFPAIQLAAWFHDVIYEPQSKDNEEQSAIYASNILTQFNLPLHIIKLVQSLILSTKDHQALPNELHTKIFLDSDLAILGASKLEYQTYSQAIRQEYSWLTEQLYVQGRKQVLQKFLQRERIYLTEQMFLRLEAKARLNIQTEINYLSQSFQLK